MSGEAWPAGAAPAAPRVLLAVAANERVEQLAAAIRVVAPAALIATAERALDTLLRSTRQPLDLLVLDLRLDDVGSAALVRHLARFAPATAVLGFDDRAADRPSLPFRVWSWQEIDAALRHWQAGLRGRREADPAPARGVWP